MSEERDARRRVDLTVVRYDRAEPCAQCPYRRDAPLGKWHAQHFVDLLASEEDRFGKVYRCHCQDGNVCVGWALDQRRRHYPSLALRLAFYDDKALVRQVESATDGGHKLFSSVRAMCEANLRVILAQQRPRKRKRVEP